MGSSSKNKSKKYPKNISTADNISPVDMDLSMLYRALENAILLYYEKNLPSDVEDVLRSLEKKYNELLEEYKDKYIPFEVVYKDKETGEIVKKKMNINARILLDAITTKLAGIIWEELKLKMPPPEFYLLMINLIQNLYARLSAIEVAVKDITNILTTLNNELIFFVENVRKFNQAIKDQNKK